MRILGNGLQHGGDVMICQPHDAFMTVQIL